MSEGRCHRLQFIAPIYNRPGNRFSEQNIFDTNAPNKENVSQWNAAAHVMLLTDFLI